MEEEGRELMAQWQAKKTALNISETRQMRQVNHRLEYMTKCRLQPRCRATILSTQSYKI